MPKRNNRLEKTEYHKKNEMKLPDGTVLVSSEYIAEKLDLVPAYVREMARKGAIPGIQIQRRWWFDLAAVWDKRLIPTIPVTRTRVNHAKPEERNSYAVLDNV